MVDQQPAVTASYVNFRDLGGHPTRSGAVRRGRLFRSDSLAHCDASDIEHLVTTHGVRTVVDLRDHLVGGAFELGGQFLGGVHDTDTKLHARESSGAASRRPRRDVRAGTVA
jgi:hypothetical protein